MKVLYVRVEDYVKANLEIEAAKLGMNLTTYCRMILIKSCKACK